MPRRPSAEIHLDGGDGPLVALLTSQDMSGGRQPHGTLPYRLDQLREQGLRLGWAELRTGPRTTRFLRRAEASLTPFAQAIAGRSLRRDAAATIAMFESEGHGLAAWRLLRHRGAPLVIIACWLADLAVDGGPARRRTYRLLYRNVDQVIVFSTNQADTLERLLGIDRRKVHAVRFGIDLDELAEVTPTDGDDVVAVGRDLGRDWATLCDAARGTGWDLQLVTRPRQVEHLDLPTEVTLHGRLERDDYLALLAGAGVVVVPTEVREYPTGQTVLLEAMAMGKACVVSDTPAMREYVQHGVTALLVPPHDALALREAVDRLRADPALRRALGEAARAQELAAGGSTTMWAAVAAGLPLRRGHHT